MVTISLSVLIQLGMGFATLLAGLIYVIYKTLKEQIVDIKASVAKSNDKQDAEIKEAKDSIHDVETQQHATNTYLVETFVQKKDCKEGTLLKERK